MTRVPSLAWNAPDRRAKPRLTLVCGSIASLAPSVFPIRGHVPAGHNVTTPKEWDRFGGSLRGTRPARDEARNEAVILREFLLGR